ncbi:hypothetical protein WK79_16060 [Burkholderia ubonensis]|nr:hypothetical protein WJ72_18595 [Burkholderia ubonensis]KVV21883.1 hypothetical protein WK79_16060 [Burkholderia ubonensis]
MITCSIDIFTESQVADVCSSDVVAGDLAQYLGAWKGNFAANMWQSAMRGDEGQTNAISAHYAEHPNVYAVLQVLFAEVLGNRPLLAYSANVEFLTGTGG